MRQLARHSPDPRHRSGEDGAASRIIADDRFRHHGGPGPTSASSRPRRGPAPALRGGADECNGPDPSAPGGVGADRVLTRAAAPPTCAFTSSRSRSSPLAGGRGGPPDPTRTGCSDVCSSEAGRLGIPPVLQAVARVPLTASCGVPAARWDGLGVAGFVRFQQPSPPGLLLMRWLLCTSTGSLVDVADTAVLVLAAGVNAANGGADPLVGRRESAASPGQRGSRCRCGRRACWRSKSVV
jgi:hypothetical protein